MELSEQGLELLKKLEGFKAKAYKDSAGKMTIGYGHMVRKGDGIPDGDVISTIKANDLLRDDVKEASDCVNQAISVHLNQNQFDALVIFVYNIGCYAFQNSTMAQLLNKAQYETASKQFIRWNKIHNSQGMFIEVAGLTNRRLAEQHLFDTPDDEEETTPTPPLQAA